MDSTTENTHSDTATDAPRTDALQAHAPRAHASRAEQEAPDATDDARGTGTPVGYTPGYLVWRLSMKWRAAMDRAVAPLGLTHAQYSLLASLRAMTAAGSLPSQRELAEQTGLEPIFVSKLARSLESSGLVLRAPHPDDTRAVQLSLTDQGAQVAARATDVVRDLHQHLTARLGGIDSPQTEALSDALRTLLDIPNRSDGSTRPAAPSDRPTARPAAGAPALTGRDIGVAFNAIRAVLDRELERHGIDFAQSTALRLIAADGPALPQARLEETLVGSLAVAAPDAPAVVPALTAKGLAGVDEAGRLDLTPAGRAVAEEIAERTAEITAQVYGGLDPADLAAAARILDQVASRARALIARS